MKGQSGFFIRVALGREKAGLGFLGCDKDFRNLINQVQ